MQLHASGEIAGCYCDEGERENRFSTEILLLFSAMTVMDGRLFGTARIINARFNESISHGRLVQLMNYRENRLLRCRIACYILLLWKGCELCLKSKIF